MTLKAAVYRERPWRPFHFYLIPFPVTIILFWSLKHFLFYSVPPITFYLILIPQLLIVLSNRSQKKVSSKIRTHNLLLSSICLNQLSYWNRQVNRQFFRALNMREWERVRERERGQRSVLKQDSTFILSAILSVSLSRPLSLPLLPVILSALLPP